MAIQNLEQVASRAEKLKSYPLFTHRLNLGISINFGGYGHSYKEGALLTPQQYAELERLASAGYLEVI